MHKGGTLGAEPEIEFKAFARTVRKQKQYGVERNLGAKKREAYYWRDLYSLEAVGNIQVSLLWYGCEMCMWVRRVDAGLT
jgi:hypothetical protein